jgi:uncharacterized protein YjbI with pentapeptide repeats
MKIFKPDSLGLLHRSIRFARKNQLSIGMMAFFPLDEALGAALLPEAQMWKVAAEAIGSDAIMDEGLPKTAGEFLVFGSAHAPSGAATPEVAVSAQVGSLSKTLRVSGDRHFNALSVISGPKPFTQMAISPQTAFGGTGSADNPSGKGLVKLKNADGSEGLPLPNVEHMAKLVLKPGDEAPAAGFWSLPPDSPLRKQHLGTFNDAWLKTSWPHLPDDTQPAYFNVAPVDQRIGGFFRGDEKIVVHNMHPQRALISSALPQLRARCFINRRVVDGEEFVEVAARAETVWLFPGQGCGIVLYRAVTPTTEEDAEDILHIMAEWESMADTPLSFSHYHEEFLRRLPQPAQVTAATAADPAFAAADATSVAMPAAAVAVPAIAVAVAPGASAAAAADFLASNPELQEVHRLAAELNKNTQETMQKHGITEADLAPYLKEAPEPPVQSLEAVEKMAADLQAHTRELMQKHNISDKDLAPFMPKPEVESANPLGEMEKALLDLQANTQATLQKTGLTQADIGAFMAKSPEMADMAGLPAPDIKAVMAGLAAVRPAAALAKPKLDVPELELPEPEPEAPPAAHKLTRDEVIARHALKQGFASQDLSGLDLSGLDLAGADFSAALLEKTSFKDSRLAGAAFKGALLAGGDFSGADLSGAMLAGVSAGSALFAKTRLDGVDASQGDFSAADFSQAQLGNANIAGSIFDGSKMAGVQAARCNAHQASFADCDLAGASMADARLTAAVFTGARLGKANFANTACDNAEFYGADATQANFTNANLKASRADATSQFAEAQLGRSHLGRAAWEGVLLARANLEGATLDDADFSRAQAAGALFGRASAKGAKFDKADLSRADFTGVNLFKGSMRHTKTEATLLRKANLYGVDFYGTSPTIASLEGSNIDQTLLLIRKPVV